MSMEKGKTSSYRLEYLDWVRGLGAVIMLQGHVFHSFLRPELKTTGAYTLSQFVGGMPPALFLFLTGVTLAFLMDSIERKGMAPRERVLQSLRRAGYLFFLAFAFRLQLWVFSGFPAPWQGVFKVDVLNCMGISIAAALRDGPVQDGGTHPPVRRARPGDRPALPGDLRDGLVRRAVDRPQLHHSRLQFLRHLSLGRVPGLRRQRRLGDPHASRATPPNAACSGPRCSAACSSWARQYMANSSFTIYAKSEFWLNSPAQVLTKVGVLFLMVSLAFLWTRYGAGEGWSWIRQFGVTSLLVYWVHIELVYGHASWFFKDNLTVPQTVFAAVIVILLMLAISTMKTHREKWQDRARPT